MNNLHLKIDLKIADPDVVIQYYHDHSATLKKNSHAGLHFLLLEEMPDCIGNIVSQINTDYFRIIYYYSNWEDVTRHSDQGRGSVITIPLINKSNIPTIFDAGNLHYDGATLVDTSIEHWVENPLNEFRLFMQIELTEDITFNEYVDLYHAGKLLK
jgi:uncharacterized protein with von Willebrand factor type A (vWA) domain